MKKVNKLILLLTALLIIVCAATLVACNNNDQHTDNGKDQTVTVKLFANDGTDEFTTKKISPNGLGSVSVPSRAGHTFDGWAFDAAGTRRVPDGYTLSKDVSLYAQWTKNVYNVTFKVNGAVVGETQNVDYLGAATAPSVTDFWNKIPEGQAFDGWDTSEFGSVERDLVVNAKLTNADFTVQFKAHNQLVARFGGKSGAVVPAPADPTIVGYSFTGWKDFHDDETKFSANVIYEAQFEFVVIESIDVFANGTEIDGSFSFTLVDTVPTLRASVTNAFEGIDYSYLWNIDSKTYNGESVTPDAFAAGGTYDCSVTCTASDDFDTPSVSKTANFRLVVTKSSKDIAVNSDVIEYDWTGNAYSNLVDAIGAHVDGDENGTFTYTLNGEPFTNETALTKGSVYRVVVRYDSDKYESEKTVIIKIKAADINGTKYTLEDALETSGEIVLFGDAVLSGDYTLKSGTKLVLPYDGSADISHELAEGTTNETFYVDFEKESTYLKRRLEIDGSLTISGELVVGGTIGAKTTNAFQGAVLGNYAQIDVTDGSTLNIVNGAGVTVHGFIKGEGDTVVENGGKLKVRFVVRDFRGGSCSQKDYLDGKICPFNQYELPSVQTWLTVYAGGKVDAIAQLFASEKFNSAESTLISFGKQTGLIQLQNGYVKAKYTSAFDGTKGSGSITGGADVAAQLAERFPCTTRLEIHGDVNLSSLQLIVVGIQLDTAPVLLSISYAYDITIASGTTTVPSQFKLLPGAKLTVAEGATLALKKTPGYIGTTSLIIYEGADWNDTTGAGYFVYPHGKPAAKFTVNGTFLIATGCSFGGKIYSNSKSAKVIVESNKLSVTSKEGYGTSNQPYCDTYTETRDAQLAAANGNVTTVVSGRTYSYNGTAWN